MSSLISICPFVFFNVVPSHKLNEDIQMILERLVQYYDFLVKTITGYDGFSLEYIQLIIDYITKEYSMINLCSDIIKKSSLVIDDKASFLKNLFNQIYPHSEINIRELCINSTKYLCFDINDSSVIVNINNICCVELQFISIMNSIVVPHNLGVNIASVFFKMIMNINACKTEYELDKTLLYRNYNIKSLIRFNIDPKVYNDIRALIDKEPLITSRQSIISYNVDSFVITDYNRPDTSVPKSRTITVQNLSFFGKCMDELGKCYNSCYSAVSYSVETAKSYYGYTCDTVKELIRHF